MKTQNDQATAVYMIILTYTKHITLIAPTPLITRLLHYISDHIYIESRLETGAGTGKDIILFEYRYSL